MEHNFEVESEFSVRGTTQNCSDIMNLFTDQSEASILHKFKYIHGYSYCTTTCLSAL